METPFCFSLGLPACPSANQPPASQPFVYDLRVCPVCVTRSQVAVLEWTEPLFFGGHWTPGLVELAGGRHPLNPADARTGAAPPSRSAQPQASR